MSYFENSIDIIERAPQTHERYNQQFAEKVKLSNTELAIAAAAGCLGGLMDMFLVTNVNNLSMTNKIGFKPESEIIHLSQSGVINDLGFVSTERRYEAPMCCTPGASK